MKRLLPVLLATLLVLALAAASAIAYLGLREDAGPPPVPVADAAAQVARGAYLARAGDCMGCHTARGGAAYAGGRAILTPFGTIPAPNITPDPDSGIGTWSADDFWRALHNGKSKDGSLLYPAFPYPNYTRIMRADADALFAYLHTLAPVRQANRPPELRFPFNYRPLLAIWRALYFRPGVYRPQPARSEDWNRGAYLVQGLGHCSACHTPRNLLGATRSGGTLSGALIPMLDWYASPLGGSGTDGLGNWPQPELESLLKTGISARGAVAGPMAEVVRLSLQHLSDSDIHAMAGYLKSLPAGTGQGQAAAPGPGDSTALALGKSLYEKHCAECHKDSGAGAPPAFPPLAGNRGVQLESPVNPIRLVLYGGYPPSTAGNPRPYGMPPFVNLLDDREAAAVVSYIRNAWGNHASLVSAGQVNRYRSVPLE